jgi:hypothetical protein
MDVVRLVDRVGTDSLISNAVFEDTVFFGPAVMALLDNVKIDACRFAAPADVLFIEVPEGQQVVGVVGIVNTTFRNCEFRNIGIIGPPEAIAHFKEGIHADETQASASSPVRMDVPSQALAAP